MNKTPIALTNRGFPFLRAAWMNPRFAQDTAIRYFSRSSGPALAEVAESIFRKIRNDFELGDSADGRRAFDDAWRREIRRMPEFGYFSNMEGSDAVSTYSRKIRRDVIGPLNSRNANSRTSTSNEKGSCGTDPAALLSLAVKLTGKLPQELCRDDVLRAAHYEGDTIANQLSQAFTRDKVEQCSWAHMQSEAGEKSVQSLMAEYRQERCPPWVTLRGNLDRMREPVKDQEWQPAGRGSNSALLTRIAFTGPSRSAQASPMGTKPSCFRCMGLFSHVPQTRQGHHYPASIPETSSLEPETAAGS